MSEANICQRLSSTTTRIKTLVAQAKAFVGIGCQRLSSTTTRIKTPSNSDWNVADGTSETIFHYNKD